MIDTIKISTEKFKIGNFDLFVLDKTNISLKEIMRGTNKESNITRSIKAHLKPIEDEIYRPRIEYVNSYYTNPMLYIEFSVPKLLFGNNLCELKEKDFNDVVKKLVKILKDLEITITENAINNALVRRVDFSKNFLLGESLTCKDIISLLSKISYPRMDLNIVEEDKYIKFYSKSISLLFYDKKEEISEIKLPQYIQTICKQDISFFRVEIQIRRENIINKIAKYHNIRKMIFKDIFNKNIVIYVFDKYLRKLNKYIPETFANEEEIEALYRGRPEILAKKMAIFRAQEKYDNYDNAIKNIKENYGEKFLKTHNCIRVEKKELQFIILKLLEELKDYTPLFNSS